MPSQSEQRPDAPMKVLFLGPDDSPLRAFLSQRETVVSWQAPLDLAFLDAHAFEFLVSYGYRHILRRPVLDRFVGRAINLHVSLLPWNRGADPNLWSILDRTPKGVTIHHLDEGVDTGDLILQREVHFGPEETLATSYARLQRAVQELFVENWSGLRSGALPRHPQRGMGSLHRMKDKAPYEQYLSRGWDTPIAELEGRGPGTHPP